MQVENPEEILSTVKRKKGLKFFSVLSLLALLIVFLILGYNNEWNFKKIINKEIAKEQVEPIKKDPPAKKEPVIVYKDSICNNLPDNSRIFIWPDKVPDVKINTFIACDDQAKQEGLSGVIELAENDGMLFVFENPDFYKFWMRETSVYLAIAFLNENKEIIEIFEPEPLSEERFGPTTQKTKYVLEVGKGWFEKHKVAVGDKINFK